MKPNQNNKLDIIALEEVDCDFRKAQYDRRLSSIGFDEETDTFWATLDKVSFKSPIELIQPVLEAHGYAVNLENVLACIDSLKLARFTRLSPRSKSLDEPGVAKLFADCVHFRLPSKVDRGPVLSKFYEEVAAYEKEVARLREKLGLKGAGGVETKTELREKIKDLSREIREQKQHLRLLNSKLAKMARSHEQATQALHTQNLLPEDLRSGTVREIQLAERIISIRVGRQTHQVPTTVVDRIAEVGQRCLVKIDGGKVKRVFFHEENSDRSSSSIMDVLFCHAGKCKLRDENRRTWVVTARHQEELDLFVTLRRGHRLIVDVVDDQIFKMRRGQQKVATDFLNKVREEVETHDIKNRSDEAILIEGKAV